MISRVFHHHHHNISIDHSRKYHNIPKCSLFVPPKVCIRIVISFSWQLKWPQEKLKTMLMQNFGVKKKEQYGMSWYFLEWSIVFPTKPTTTYPLFSLHQHHISIIFRPPPPHFFSFFLYHHHNHISVFSHHIHHHKTNSEAEIL